MLEFLMLFIFFRKLKTDLILMTDIYGYNVNSILKKGSISRVKSLKKIMALKLLNGNIVLERIH